MTLVRFVNAVADCYGKKVTTDEAHGILWEFTGYPSFWHTDNHTQELRHQLAEFFQGGYKRCPRCGVITHPHDFEVGVCIVCVEEAGWL